MTRVTLFLAAFYLAGCAQLPTASDPSEHYGWSSRRMCFNACRPVNGIVKVGVRF